MTYQSVLYKLLSVFIWSMYPVFIALGSNENSLGWFIVFVHVSTAVGAYGCGVLSVPTLRRAALRQRFKRAISNMNIDQWGFVIGAGLCSTLYNLCFLYAMLWTSKAGVAVMIEAAPIYAMMLTTVIVTKTWQSLSLRHAITSIVILIGVGFVIIADQSDIKQLFVDYDEYIKTSDFMSLVGCLVALLGSIMAILSDLMRAQVGNITTRLVKPEDSIVDRDLTGIIFGEAFVRIISIPMGLMILLFFGDISTFSVNDMVYAVVTGFLIFNFGSITYAAALLKSSSPAIALLDYLSPPLSIFILVIIGLSTINADLIIGTTLIILGNVYLFWADKRAETKKKITPDTVLHP